MAIDFYINNDMYRLPCAKAVVNGRAINKEIISLSGINGSFIVNISEGLGTIEVNGLHPDINGYTKNGIVYPSMEQMYLWKDVYVDKYLSIHGDLYKVTISSITFDRELKWANIARRYSITFEW